MSWAILLLASVFEIAFAIGLKYSQGLTRPLATTFAAVSGLMGMGLLAFALKSLPVGTAYAIWTGIGTIGTAVLGMIFLKEPISAARLVCIAMVVTGIVGLKLATP